MKSLSLLLAVALGLATAVSAGPAVIECWFVEDTSGKGLAKRPGALLLRQGQGNRRPGRTSTLSSTSMCTTPRASSRLPSGGTPGTPPHHTVR